LELKQISKHKIIANYQSINQNPQKLTAN
jgi:hypothetical protein